MRYRVLGSIEIEDAHGWRPLAGRKQRAVFAVLLLHRNMPVCSDQLFDAVWGDSAISHRGAVLANQVSALRKGLHARGHSVLITTPSGYMLRAEPDTVDVDRFERLLDQALEELARGRPAAAAEAARRCLALWRGRPFEEFTYESFAQAEIARLEERRLGALEVQVEARLALGEHHSVICDLEALVREHPLRERLHGHLMLALYRCGRQGDALAAYHAARRSLLEALGIEPCRELRRLEQAILQQDLALEPPSPAGRALSSTGGWTLRPPWMSSTTGTTHNSAVLASCWTGGSSSAHVIRTRSRRRLET